jgi:hypothetical protein
VAAKRGCERGSPGVGHDLHLGAVAHQRVEEQLGAAGALGHEAACERDNHRLVVAPVRQRAVGGHEGGQRAAHRKLVRERVLAGGFGGHDVLHSVLKELLQAPEERVSVPRDR